MAEVDRLQQVVLMRLVQAIAAGDVTLASSLLAASPDLARATFVEGATRRNAKSFFIDEVGHYVYAGDTALHVAAAAYQPDMARALIAAGADIRARNRRGAEPLHYAADGKPGSRRWSPQAQATTVADLIEAGADPDASDKNGATPLHRAVRTRCSAAVRVLLESGADTRLKNRNGSTPIDLATRASGRGGAGSPEAKAEQHEIERLLRQRDPRA